jgi:hypothetical protein
MAEAEPTSPWEPSSAPEIEAFVLMMPPSAAAVSRKSRMLAWSASGGKCSQ